jgi:hypothetical protein
MRHFKRTCYIQAHPTAHAYFKSTDGHHSNWAFNLRRPNIHLLPIVAAQGGYVAPIHMLSAIAPQKILAALPDLFYACPDSFS